MEKSSRIIGRRICVVSKFDCYYRSRPFLAALDQL